jgi:NADH dehydrogenase [ubiquinone] 1 alpha subcomplex assembly factor 7
MERLDHFMARANAAYYATHDPYRDFTTSPEISQVFGEILGLWAAVTWRQIGAPSPVSFVEAGPGRGTLMVDALRAIARTAPDFHAALRLHLIETSPRLRALQAERLDATWHDSLNTLPDQSLLLLANEFLDALPIRQFVQRRETWTERHVVEGEFVERASETPPPLAGGGQGEGLFEHNEPALSFVRSLANRLARHPGAALIIDYGSEHEANGDSLQAIRDGKPADPLSDPGTADLTAHVDFAAIATAARNAGATVHGAIPQGVFLTHLGLFQRTDRLAQSQPAKAMALIDAARRLAEPDRMGRLFKVLALISPSAPTPPGFEA